MLKLMDGPTLIAVLSPESLLAALLGVLAQEQMQRVIQDAYALEQASKRPAITISRVILPGADLNGSRPA